MASTRSLCCAALSSGQWVRRGSPMIWATVMRGSSEASGSWKIICTALRLACQAAGLAPRISSPCHTTLPSVMGTRLSSARASVDLPQPDSPTMPNVSPACRSNDTPSTALRYACGCPGPRALTPNREVDPQVPDRQQWRLESGCGAHAATPCSAFRRCRFVRHVFDIEVAGAQHVCVVRGGREAQAARCRTAARPWRNAR